MAYDKVIDSSVLDAGLKQIADAIREKGGTTDSLAFPQAMADAITAIEAGGGDDVLNALIDRSITEISSNAKFVGQYAFYYCTSLKTADFPVATSIAAYAFYNVGLTQVNFPLVKTIGEYAFSANTGAPNFETVSFPSATSIGSNAFSSVHKLIEINTDSLPLVTVLSSNAFYNCTSLKTADFPSVTSISYSVFSRCKSLTSLILRSTTMTTLSNTNAFSNCYHILGTVDATYNPDGLKDGYIYVPSALVESYKTATNWSTYASQFRALEDYTVDGTITGELDPNKI